MKWIKHYLLLIILVFSLNCQDDEIEKTPPNLSLGTATFAGVEFQFNYYLREIRFTNHNDVVVKIGIYNYNKRSVLVKDLITFPGNTNHVRYTLFDPGDEIEIKIWQGFGSVYHGSVQGLPADYLGEGFLTEGEIVITNPTNQTSYLVSLPIANGADCEISGQYTIGNPHNQNYNILYCDNVSSDTIRVELYKIKLNSTADGYEQDFEIASMWLLSQINDTTDAAIIYYNLDPYENLALRITSYDPFDATWVYQDQYGFRLNILNESFTYINLPIDLP